MDPKLREKLLSASIISKLTLAPSNRIQIAIDWIKEDQRSGADALELIRFFKNDNKKKIIAFTWLRRSGQRLAMSRQMEARPEIAVDDMVEFLPFIKDDRYESELALSWIISGERTGEDLEKIFPLILRSGYKSKAAEYWLKSVGRSKEDLLRFLPFVSDKKSQSEKAILWLDEKERSVEDLTQILPFTEKSKIVEVIEIFLSKNHDEKSKYSNFLQLSKLGLVGRDIYDIGSIAEIYHQVGLSVASFPDFCKELYPYSENLQTELFYQGIAFFSEDRLSQNKANFLSFISTLQSDELAFQSTIDLKTKIYLTPLELLEVSTLRLSINYESVFEILSSKSVAESLTPEGLSEIQSYFCFNGEDLLEGISLANLFSFYHMQEQEGGLSASLLQSVLKPEVLFELRQSFSPSDKKVLVWDRDFKIMDEVLGQQGFDLGFLPVSILSDCLVRSGEFSNFSITEIDSYQIGNSSILDPEKRIETNEEFKILLKLENPSPKKVGEFFEKILGLEESINSTQRGDLQEFFNRDKLLLARLLQQNGGLDKFNGAITALADGCFANISTQVRISATQSLIADPCDQILFRIFGEKVSGPILTNPSIGVDHLNPGENAAAIFLDPRIAQHKISPTGLVRAIREEFFKNGKKIEDSQNFLTAVCGEGYYQQRYLEIEDFCFARNSKSLEAGSEVELTRELLETYFANLATAIIIERRLPDLLTNGHVAKFFWEVDDLDLLFPRHPSASLNLVREVDALQSNMSRLTNL